MNRVKDLWKLMRPHQWTKNVFVLAGLIFGHAWDDHILALQALLTVISFMLLSSAVYVGNDIIDVENDRRHPKKKNRPIASGKVSVNAAMALCSLLVLLGLALGAYVSIPVLVILGLYLLLNIAYSLSWKKIVILDVFCIATGFMLRILAGTIGLGIPPSKWLLLCGLMLTLFLGFAKRRAEMITLKSDRDEFRPVLAAYSPLVLDEIIAICATGVILSYSLYTMSVETTEIHHTEGLIYTVPFVIYAIFRYIFLLHKERMGGEPSRDLFKDRHIIFSVFAWTASTIFIILKYSNIENIA